MSSPDISSLAISATVWSGIFSWYNSRSNAVLTSSGSWFSRLTSTERTRRRSAQVLASSLRKGVELNCCGTHWSGPTSSKCSNESIGLQKRHVGDKLDWSQWRAELLWNMWENTSSHHHPGSLNSSLYTHTTNAWQTWEWRSAASSPAPLHTDPTEPGQQAELLPDGTEHSKSKNATSSGWQLPGIHHHSAHNPALHSEVLPPQPHTLVPSVHPWILSHQTGGMTAGKSVRRKKITETVLWFVDRASRYIRVMKTNLIYY